MNQKTEFDLLNEAISIIEQLYAAHGRYELFVEDFLVRAKSHLDEKSRDMRGKK